MGKRSNGEGTITQRKDGIWLGALSIGYDGAGKRKRRYVYGKSQKEVREKLNGLKKSVAEGRYADPSKRTLAEQIEVFLKAKALNVKPRTVEIYEGIGQRYVTPRLGQRKLESITTAHVEATLLDIAEKHSADAAHKSRAMLMDLFGHAEELGLISYNPVTRVRKIKVERRKPNPLTSEQAALLLTYAQSHRFYALWYLALSSGLRLGELLGLQWGDLTNNGLMVRRSQKRLKGKILVSDPKTAKGNRFVPLSHDALEVLEEHRKKQAEQREGSKNPWPHPELVFASSTGTSINPSNYYREWKALLEKVGIEDLSTHDLRHTFATWEIHHGANPKSLATLLGHSRASFTLDVYTHDFAKTQEGKALSLEGIFAALKTETTHKS